MTQVSEASLLCLSKIPRTTKAAGFANGRVGSTREAHVTWNEDEDENDDEDDFRNDCDQRVFETSRFEEAFRRGSS
jgi:hypothetical protein